MPLLITLCHLSREQREGLPSVLAPETLKGRLPGTGCQLALLPEPFTQGDSSQLWSPGRCRQTVPSIPVLLGSRAWLLSSTGPKDLPVKIGDIMTLEGYYT